MSVLNFARQQYIKSIDTGEEIRTGGFRINQDGEWGAVRHVFFINGTLSGTEQCRTKIYSDADHTNLLYTSDWSSDFSEIGKDPTSDGWYGYLTNDFNGENINGVFWYYIGVELQNYTRNFETFYIGLTRDFPFPIYEIDPVPLYFFQHPLATQIFLQVYR